LHRPALHDELMLDDEFPTEEPYEPPQPEPDYKTMGYGDILRGMSFHGTETAEEWEAKDAILRREEKFTLDEVLPTDLGGLSLTFSLAIPPS